MYFLSYERFKYRIWYIIKMTTRTLLLYRCMLNFPIRLQSVWYPPTTIYFVLNLAYIFTNILYLLRFMLLIIHHLVPHCSSGPNLTCAIRSGH